MQPPLTLTSQWRMRNEIRDGPLHQYRVGGIRFCYVHDVVNMASYVNLGRVLTKLLSSASWLQRWRIELLGSN